MDTLNEQGLFWITSKVESGFLIPDDAISGTLVVSDEGLASLSLNGVFAKAESLASMFEFDGLPEDVFVAGILRSDARQVILKNLQRGSWKLVAGGISYEQYTASYCLVGAIDECLGIQELSFSSTTMGLDEYQDWLGYKLIDAKQIENGLSVNVALPEDVQFAVNDDIELRINGKYLGRWGSAEQARSLTLSAGINWELHFKNSMSIEDAEHYFRVVSEFLMLLSGSGCKPDWPFVSNVRDGRSRPARLYFLREKEEVKSAKLHDGFVYFKQVLPIIGDLFNRWLDVRESMGPGAYLFFLALTPGRLYTEHLYASMVWGMERYHRKLYGNTLERDEAKIKRQIEAIETLVMLRGKERKALRDFVNRDIEPSLKDRVKCLVEDLPIYFDKRSLDEFCDACARRRNDISHFGGYRDQVTNEAMDKFYQELHDKVFVLTHLYGAVLMKSIGVPDAMINFYFYKGRRSGWLKRHFESAGLKYEINRFSSGD